MKTMFKKLKVFIQRQLDRIPTRLPDGMTALEAWSKSLIDTYGFPDNDSVRFMLSSMVLSLGPTVAYKPKRYFALCGLAAASKEVAHYKMTLLKQAQDAKKASEASAISNVTSIQLRCSTSTLGAK